MTPEVHPWRPSPASAARDNKEFRRRDLLRFSLLGGGALVLGAGLLSACSAEGKNSNTSDGKPRAGGKVTLGVVADIANFDPYVNLTTNFIILQNLNSFLVNYDDQLQAKPSALKAWEFAPDHRAVTLRLRSDIKLQTGKTWTSDDLVAGIKRAQNPNEAGNLLGPSSIIQDVSASDKETVVLTFKQPTPELVVTDILESFPVVDSDGNNSAALANKPASAGPFKLESRSPNDSLTLVRYADYWDKPKPYLERVVFKIFDNFDAQSAALQSGAIDGALYLQAKDAKQLAEGFQIVKGYSGALVNIVRLNPSVAPFDNLKLRQAIQRSIDRERIVRDVYFGFGEPTVLPWGPKAPAADPSYNERFKFDLNAAKQLWQEAGSPASGEALANGTDAEALQILQIVQADLKKIGFNLEIKTQDPQTFVTNLIAGKFGLVVAPVGNSSKSPSRLTTNSLFRTVHNPVWKDNIPQEYLDAVKAVETAITPKEEKAAYAELNKVLADQAWGLGISPKLSLFAFAKKVTGATRDVDDRIMLVDAWV